MGHPVQSVSGAYGQELFFPSLAVGLQDFEVSLADIIIAKLWSTCETSCQGHKSASLVFGHRPFGQRDQTSTVVSTLTVKRRLTGLLFPGRPYWSPCPAA